MTLKDIAKQLTTAVQTVPNLVQILRDGFEQATAGSTVEVTQVVSTGTKIASVKVDDNTTDLYTPSASSAIFIDTSNVIKDDFTMDAQFHTWEASADCVLTGNCDAPDSTTAWVIQINDKQVGAGYQVMCPFIYVKAGQTVKYRVKSASNLIAYGLQS